MPLVNLADFWAPWCGPCLAVAPLLNQIAAERQGELKVVKVNVVEERKLAVSFGISSIPAIILFKNGEPVAGTIGARRKPQLEKALGLAPLAAVDTVREPGGVRGLVARLAGRRS